MSTEPFTLVTLMGTDWPLPDPSVDSRLGLKSFAPFTISGTFALEPPVLNYRATIGRPKRLPRKTKKALKKGWLLTQRERLRLFRIKWPVTSMTPAETP